MRHFAIALVMFAGACGNGPALSAVDGSADRAEPDGKSGDAVSADGDAQPDVGSPDRADVGPDGATSMCYPPCLERLFQGCFQPMTGTCTRQDVGTLSNYCYSNGVFETITPVADGSDGGSSGETSVFTKADGTTPCWSAVSNLAPGSITFTYYDAAGTVIAAAKFLMPDDPLGDVAYSCGGTTTVTSAAKRLSPECKRVREFDCTEGTCP